MSLVTMESISQQLLPFSRAVFRGQNIIFKTKKWCLSLSSKSSGVFCQEVLMKLHFRGNIQEVLTRIRFVAASLVKEMSAKFPKA